MEIRPHHGVAWAPRTRVGRLPATYKRSHGTMYLFGAYDVNHDQLWGLPFERQRQGEVLAFFKLLRDRYPPDQRLYIVMDNRSAHTTEAVLSWVRRHKMTLVLTPTYCSWMNRVECHFTALKKFALSGCYFQNHAQQMAAIMRYLLYRNQHKIKPNARHRDIRVNLC